MVKRPVQNKELLIFILLTYGGSCLMGIVTAMALQMGLDVGASLVFPAMAVILAKLVLNRKDPLLPKRFFICVLALCGLQILIHLIVFLQPLWDGLQGAVLVIYYALMILCFVFFFLESKASRKAYGLAGSNWKNTFLFVGLFLILLTIANGLFAFLTEMISPGAGPQFGSLLEALARGSLFSLVGMMISLAGYFCNTFLEEYGWRYYLQPILQKKLGPKQGILLLAILWEIWHYPSLLSLGLILDDPMTVLQSILLRLPLVASLTIFFGFVYLKTNNIWATVFMHFLYNEFPHAVDYITWTPYAQENWMFVLVYGVCHIGIFFPFLFTKTFRPQKKLSSNDPP